MPPPMILEETSVTHQSEFAGMAGAVLVASLTSACLYGFTLLLVLQYFKSHAKRDPWHLKSTMGILCLLATLVTAFLSVQVYDMFITQNGEVTLPNEIKFDVVGQYTCISLTAFITQIFFASRIWKSGRYSISLPPVIVTLTPNSMVVGTNFGSLLRYTAIPVGILSTLQMSSGLAQVYILQKTKFFSKLGEHSAYLKQTTTIQGSASILCDVLISLAFSILLHSHRSGIKRTDSLVNKLILYAINRAVATSLCAMISTALYYNGSSGSYYLYAVLLLIIPYAKLNVVFLKPSTRPCDNLSLRDISSQRVRVLFEKYFRITFKVELPRAAFRLTSREGLRKEAERTIELSDLSDTTFRPDTVLISGEADKRELTVGAPGTASQAVDQTGSGTSSETDPNSAP
ncbi:hypothetical protein CPC08DRAFT_755422 [Agrocybe pediades]|nr:hypothetical protein CPC08DRAFT_755422 [Agrocybe pediades]